MADVEEAEDTVEDTDATVVAADVVEVEVEVEAAVEVETDVSVEAVDRVEGGVIAEDVGDNADSVDSSDCEWGCDCG